MNRIQTGGAATIHDSRSQRLPWLLFPMLNFARGGARTLVRFAAGMVERNRHRAKKRPHGRVSQERVTMATTRSRNRVCARVKINDIRLPESHIQRLSLINI